MQMLMGLRERQKADLHVNSDTVYNPSEQPLSEQDYLARREALFD